MNLIFISVYVCLINITPKGYCTYMHRFFTKELHECYLNKIFGYPFNLVANNTSVSYSVMYFTSLISFKLYENCESLMIIIKTNSCIKCLFSFTTNEPLNF